MTFTIPKKQMSPLAVVEGANRNNLCEKTSFRSFIFYFFPYFFICTLFLSLSSKWSALRFDKQFDCSVQQTFNEDQEY